VNKTKKLTFVAVGVCVVSLSLIFGSGFTVEKDKDYSISEKYSNHLSVFLKKERNAKASKEKLGFDTTTTTNIDSEVKVNFKVHVIKDQPSFVDVTGNGVIRVEKDNFNFKILDSTRLHKAQLGNGNTLIWGPIDGILKNKKGEDDMLTLGITYIPETNQKFITSTIGTMDSGFAAATFGNYDFVSEEMTNIMKNEVN
jgi:hypothetical protein